MSLPRFPSLSPDGSQVVFSWRGDLWKVPTAGGRAVRLTSHPADETVSIWSPDGRSIAFVSSRDGYGNIWRMSADGSGITRVTDLDRSCSLTDWTVVDGQERILFHAVLEADVYREFRPYHVSPEGGPVERVHDAHGSQPRLSPDGTRVLFARGGYYDGWERRHYRGPENQDVWLQDRASGAFTRLTRWAGNDGKAAWLDDRTVLYLSDREDRAVNLYRRSVDEPEPRAVRLTRFTDRDIHDWALSADGSTAVLMSWDTLHRLDLRAPGAEPQPIAITANQDTRDTETFVSVGRNVSDAALSPDGSVMAMIAYGEIWVRPTDKNGTARRVTRSHAREADLAWSPDGLSLYFTSDRDGTESIYRATVSRTRTELKETFSRSLEPAAAEGQAEDDALEATDPGPMDPLSGSWTGLVTVPDAGEVPFTLTLQLEEDGRVTGTLDAGETARGEIEGRLLAEESAVELQITLEDGTVIPVRATFAEASMRGTAEYEGRSLPFEATRAAAEPTAAEDGGAGSEDSAEAEPDSEDTDPSLDPARWADAIEFTIEPVLVRPNDDRRPLPSPDGLRLLVRGVRGDLHLLDLATGDVRTLLEHWDSRIEAEWSPCGRYLAWAVSDLDFNRDIWIHEIDGEAPAINITRHPDNDGSMSWSADSRLMAFVSERVGEEYDVWVVALDEDFEALQGPDLEASWETARTAAKARKPLTPMSVADRAADAAEAEDAEDADADTAEPPFTREDLETAYLRLRRLTRLEGNEFQARILPSGERIVFTASGLASGLHSIAWDGSDRKELGSTGRIVGTDLSGGKVVVVSGGQAQTLSPTGGSRETASFSDRIRVDLAEQSSQKFLEASRALGENFYHPEMNGVDWARLTDEYHQLARGAFTADEFNWVANRFLGELNASHLGIRAPGDVDTPLRESRGRLGVDTRVVDEGLGREITAILPRSPAALGEMALRVGDVILAIEGEPMGPRDTLEGRLLGRAGQETIVRVRRDLTEDDAAGRGGESVELDLLLTPTGFGEIRSLGYEAWVLERKRLVTEFSGGRLGYIHIQGMNQASLDVFERDLFAAVNGREGLIVDVRDNGGGSTADRLLASIMVRPHAWTVPRGADWSRTGHYPQDRLFIQRYVGPMNFLCNEKSYSNAEIISHAFKTLERGTLVGQQTHGSVISTGGIRLIDGTSVRMPFRGWFVDDGTGRDMELNGALPDLVVPQEPWHEAAGEDPQLRAAVEDLLGRLEG
ncbi:MAG: S41 family peptidase [Planctomycetota bacterium]